MIILKPDLSYDSNQSKGGGATPTNSEVSKSNSNILVASYFFLENCVTSEGDVSHCVLYYQRLPLK